MRHRTEALGQGHLFETRTEAVTRSRMLNERIARTHELCEDVLDNPAENADLQSKANAIIALSEQDPLPYFDVARALIDMGIVRNAYDFSIGTEDDCLMMVMDRERASKSFLERALQYAANGKTGGAATIEQAWELLRILSTEETDNLTCAEHLASMHPVLTEMTPKCIRIFWSNFRKAYASFCECTEAKLTSSLPILHMIGDHTTQAINWQDASAAWRERYGAKKVVVS